MSYPMNLVYRRNHMKTIKKFADDILLLAGFILLVIAGSYVSPAVALYTAAVECLSGAYLINYTLTADKAKGVDMNAHS